jgi:hypothetical protein
VLLVLPFYYLFDFIIRLYYFFINSFLAIIFSLLFTIYDTFFYALIAFIYSTILLLLFLVSNFPYCITLQMILVATFSTDFHLILFFLQKRIFLGRLIFFSSFKNYIIKILLLKLKFCDLDINLLFQNLFFVAKLIMILVLEQR